MKTPDTKDIISSIIMLGLGAAASGLIWYGSTNTALASVQSDVKELRDWRNEAMPLMGRMDAKLNILLNAQGFSPDGRKKRD